MKKIYIPEIDGLRAVAVISVVLFHAGFSLFSGGYVGVDVFFVISGYLITGLVVDEVGREKAFSFSEFYLRRARRLFPALYFVLVGTFVFAFLLLTPQHFQRFGGELLYSATSLSNFYFWSEGGYFNTSSEFKPLLHTWSLSVEEQFYLIWPVVLVFLLRNARRWVGGVLFATALLSLFANYVMADGYSSVLSAISPTAAEWFKDGVSTIFFLTPFRVFEFAIGAALVFLKKYQPKNGAVAEVLMAAGLIMIGYAVFFYTEEIVFPSYNALIPCVGAALVIFSVRAKRVGIAFRNGVAVLIGRSSYSIYLVHWPVVVFYKYYKIAPLNSVDQVVIVLAALLLGWLVCRYVETPFRYPAHAGRSEARAGFAFACSGLVIVLALPAATVWANSGWKWRTADLPNEIATQVMDSKQFHVDQYGGAGFPEPYGWVSGGQDGVADIVVIGDSHAAQLKTGLKEIVGDPHNKSIFFGTYSCLILPGVTRITPGSDFDSVCPSVLSNALAVIDRSENAVVVIAASWDFQVKYAARLDGKVPFFDGDLREAFWKILPSLDSLKERIGDRQLVIVGGVPGAGIQDVMGCYLRPKYFSYDCEGILAIPEIVSQAVIGNAVFDDYARSRRGVHFFDPFDAFCANGVCRSIKDRKVLYSDSYHLSKEGSRVFVGYMYRDLMQIVERSPER